MRDRIEHAEMSSDMMSVVGSVALNAGMIAIKAVVVMAVMVTVLLVNIIEVC